jgi:hypothetical protein
MESKTTTFINLYCSNNNGKTRIRWLNTSEFFKCFWIDIGKCVLRSINYGYEKEWYVNNSRRGIVTSIIKGDKPKR